MFSPIVFDLIAEILILNVSGPWGSHGVRQPIYNFTNRMRHEAHLTGEVCLGENS